MMICSVLRLAIRVLNGGSTGDGGFELATSNASADLLYCSLAQSV